MLKTTAIKRNRSTIETGEGLTEQAHKKECDVNYIIKKYIATGLITHAKQYEGQYDDVSVQDFQQAMDIIQKSQTMFDALPAHIRKQMDNDPATFLEFTSNPSNREALEKMGILKGNDGKDSAGKPTLAPKPEEKTETVIDPPGGGS